MPDLVATLGDDPDLPPLSFPLPDGWRDAAGVEVRRVVGMILAGLPRLISEPHKLKATALLNIRGMQHRTAFDVAGPVLHFVHEGGYRAADFIEAVSIHYAAMIDAEVDRIVAERSR